jgi:hypothetical protein
LPSPALEPPLRTLLERAADGLVYTSESDRPFEFVSFPGASAGEPLTVERFAPIVGAPAGTRVEERDLDRFFARHLETSDPLDVEAQRIRPRYEALKAALRGELRDVRVFRVVEGVEVRCYVVGWAPDGSLSGLATTAIET